MAATHPPVPTSSTTENRAVSNSDPKAGRTDVPTVAEQKVTEPENKNTSPLSTLNTLSTLRKKSTRPSNDPPIAPVTTGLIAQDLFKAYRRRSVVHGVNIQVQRGEVVGLLGPNGAGKTTCFYMMTGLTSVDSGDIWIDGFPVTRLPMYQRARLGLGYLPQEASIFRGLTVEQNLEAVVQLVATDKADQKEKIDRLLEEFNITRLRDTPAIALSGGERRRLEIARALATGPDYMLLDEPFAGIDPLAISDIRDLVKHLKDRGIGVLITDHNVRETLEIIDRAYIIHEGNVLIEGTPDEIVSNEEVRRVYLGETFKL